MGSRGNCCVCAFFFFWQSQPSQPLSLTAVTVFALFLLGNTYDIPSLMRLALLPTMIYNLVAVLPVYAFVRLLQRRLEGGLQIAAHSLTLGAETGSYE